MKKNIFTHAGTELLVQLSSSRKRVYTKPFVEKVALDMEEACLVSVSGQHKNATHHQGEITPDDEE